MKNSKDGYGELFGNSGKILTFALISFVSGNLIIISFLHFFHNDTFRQIMITWCFVGAMIAPTPTEPEWITFIYSPLLGICRQIMFFLIRIFGGKI